MGSGGRSGGVRARPVPDLECAPMDRDGRPIPTPRHDKWRVWAEVVFPDNTRTGGHVGCLPLLLILGALAALVWWWRY
jgi:hypothetical protein